MTPEETRKLLEVAAEMAPLLREQGVEQVIVSGISITLLPKAPDRPDIDSNPEGDDENDDRRDPLNDSSSYNRADGYVPGFPKLRR